MVTSNRGQVVIASLSITPDSLSNNTIKELALKYKINIQEQIEENIKIPKSIISLLPLDPPPPLVLSSSQPAPCSWSRIRPPTSMHQQIQPPLSRVDEGRRGGRDQAMMTRRTGPTPRPGRARPRLGRRVTSSSLAAQDLIESSLSGSRSSAFTSLRHNTLSS
ncbi:hypothetical protein OsJ_13798 [Oryza sativa Japonica Group]|uniref:OSJNBb0089K06.15 protein n=2 Tax=Oryza TaxID=4527 RepID=Q7XX82_ORYSJ|nr:hypothetical protein OsJ_13798 [Oryza sativa Japonica Group]CAD39682.1 OSJNBb0089K06.15 [Oryza sativa Japonica Group]